MPHLDGQDILAFTYADWNASWSTPQQILSRLAPENRVLYVDQPRSFLYGLKGPDPQGAGAWQGPRLQEVRPNLFAYHPPHLFLPVGGLPLALAKTTLTLNGRLLAFLVRRQMRRLGMVDPLLWNFSPLHGTAIPHLRKCLTIYDVCDEWANYVGNVSGRKVLAWIEEHLCRSADLVFVGTENMKTLREVLNEHIEVIHHGADYEHFATAALPDTPVPEDIACLPRPVIGSVGVLDPFRFDVDLILSIARSRPDWSLALVGPPRADMDLDRLKSCDNVYLLGNKPIEDLPKYIKGMDVTIIPYKVNEATRYIYPLKLQEYLSTGKAVVSAALPAILPYEAVVYIARDNEDFLAKLGLALEEDNEERRAERQAVARQNSWTGRAQEKSEYVMQHLERACTQAKEIRST